MKLVEVWLEHPIMKIDRTFTYFVKDTISIETGMRVSVEFNRQNLIGFVDSVEIKPCSKEEYEQEIGYQIKEIQQIIDESSILNQELFDLGKWMAYHTISSTISCFQAMLPAKIKPKTNSKKIKMVTMVRFHHEGEYTTKQQEAISYLKEVVSMKKSLFVQQFKSCTKALIQEGIVECYEEEVKYEKKEMIQHQSKQLTVAQKNAFDSIILSNETVNLLHGLTGSGKTEIYLQLASYYLKQGKEVIVLVPEISLTPQMVERVQERFGEQVAIYHSRLNDQEKYEQYKRVKEKEVSIVVGTRSAIFMPFTNIGLIILDEEHDYSYKQDSTPRYHTRDIALKRGESYQAKVLLASATPSLESYARAIKGIYKLVELNERINQNPLPKCYVVDTKQALRIGQSNIITKPLLDKIEDRIQKNQQVILLLNRRGYTSVLRCKSCNEVVQCPNCDIAMSYHKEEQSLKCHTCGYHISVPKSCPKCGHSQFSWLGFGTQRVVEELQRALPKARVLRMDADALSKKGSHQSILDGFKNHNYDVLVGTQMIAKGLDFPLVTLVGIIQADALLARTDFRSVETTFDLIVQASGRSGRSVDKGEVIIQVFEPNHYAILSAQRQDYRSFFEKEMQYRHLGNYPPYCYLISLVFSNINAEASKEEAVSMYQRLKQYADIKVLGPSELTRIKDRYRYRIILKGKNLNQLLELMQVEYQAYIQKNSKVQLSVDVNPLVLD